MRLLVSFLLIISCKSMHSNVKDNLTLVGHPETEFDEKYYVDGLTPNYLKIEPYQWQMEQDSKKKAGFKLFLEIGPEQFNGRMPNALKIFLKNNIAGWEILRVDFENIDEQKIYNRKVGKTFGDEDEFEPDHVTVDFEELPPAKTVKLSVWYHLANPNTVPAPLSADQFIGPFVADHLIFKGLELKTTGLFRNDNDLAYFKLFKIVKGHRGVIQYGTPRGMVHIKGMSVQVVKLNECPNKAVHDWIYSSLNEHAKKLGLQIIISDSEHDNYKFIFERDANGNFKDRKEFNPPKELFTAP